MEIITATGNKRFYEELKEINTINYPDIQYQEAVLEILEKNKKIRILILSSILPGELTIEEFINVIKYNNPNLIIFIILEKENTKLKNFLIAKGITNIYYNNKTTYAEIINKINNNMVKNKIKIKNNIIKKEIVNIKKTTTKIIKIINKNKIIKIIKNKYQKNRLNKTVAIIGAEKIGKSTFILILNKIIKNKKILIVDLNAEENNLKIILGERIKNRKIIENNIIKINNNLDVLLIGNKNKKNNQKIIFEQLIDKYDYIFFEIKELNQEKEIIAKIENVILLVEANLLGIKEAKDILQTLIYSQKTQKDKIKVVFNKQNEMSICNSILKMMFSDFGIIGTLKYSKFYNLFINTNGKILNNKIKKEYKRIINKIID